MQQAGESRETKSRALRGEAQQHYCDYQIITVSACRRKCETRLPIGVDAERA